MIPGRRLKLNNVQAETGVLLYRVSRGRDNFSLDSSLNCITFSPDGNFLTSRGREVLFSNNIFVLVVFVTVFKFFHELHYLHLQKEYFSLVEFMRCAFVITALKESFYANLLSTLCQFYAKNPLRNLQFRHGFDPLPFWTMLKKTAKFVFWGIP